MIKKIRYIYTGTLIVALPIALYTFVYTTSLGSYSKVEGVTESKLPITPLVVATSKPVSLVDNNTKPVVKKPILKKKAPIRKKVVKKKMTKRKERLTITPPLFTPQTAPHTAR